MPEDNPSTESVAENSHIEELLTWKIECFNHIRWLENTDWKSMTLIGTITFAIIGFLVQYVAEPGSYSSDLAIMILGLVIAFNMIGVAIILRNRRGFLENLYQASVVEHALGKKTDQFEFIMSLRPKNWDLSENPAFKNIINFGSVFSYLVIFHLFLIAVSFVGMFYLATTRMISIGVILIFIICVYVFYCLYNSYKKWWKNQEWIKRFEQLAK